ncbi:MAG: HIT domain-containing protein [Planctomycetes bacterium]|nr:HIT domain-containing protein [Planctomycetota bacterium]
MSDANCIFCKIVAGRIPCTKVYEDARVLGFLDVGPLSEGHCLIVPKAHAVRLEELAAADVQACAAAAAKVGKAVVAATGAPGWNLLQNNGPAAGQVVMHVHFHIIPRRDGDALGFRWPAGKLASEDAQRLAAAITGKL